MKRLAANAALLAALSTTAGAATVSELADAVELFLVKQKAFVAVSCKRDDFDGHEFVLCRPAGAKAPDILVIVEPGDRPAIYRVNGKAKQYLKAPAAELMDGTPVPIGDWTGDPIDIPAAIEEVTGWF